MTFKRSISSTVNKIIIIIIYKVQNSIWIYDLMRTNNNNKKEKQQTNK